MEITMTVQTPSTPCTASGFAMPMGGQCSFDATGLTIAMTLESALATNGTVVRDRKDLAVKGHVAPIGFLSAAYVPGDNAWSPPPC